MSALGFLVLLLSFGAIASTAREAEAARRGYLVMSSLRLGLGWSYGQRWGDHMDADAFIQNYNAGLSGYYLDPRLMTYRLGLSLSDRQATNNFGGDFWSASTSLTLSFFNNINRNRGLKLWRYVPSPLILGYSYGLTRASVFQSYNMTLYYHRSGFLRFFSNGKLMYYSRTRGGGSGNINRYRSKYQNNSFNYNRYGNGNWNRNGNGNWNRNGNGNWNRNGNGNWNRNGNGNWNRNGNGNWNRNGNGNWNRNNNNYDNNNGRNNGAGNAGNNWNAGNRAYFENLNKIKTSRNMSLTFPTFSLDLHGATSRSRKGANSSRDINSSAGSVRMRTDNNLGKASNGYASKYEAWHRFDKNSVGADWYFTGFKALNRWGKFRLWQDFEKSYTGSPKLEYDMGADYNSRYKRIGYALNLGGNYTETDDYTIYSYGASASARTGLMSRRRLTPDLFSTTSVSFGVNRSRETVINGKKYPGKNFYGVSLLERLEYVRFRHVLITSSLETRVNDGGYPLHFKLRGDSRKLRRMSINGIYSYNKFFPRLYEGNTTSHSLSSRLGYSFNADVNMNHTLTVSEQLETRGQKVDVRGWAYGGSVAWRISPKTSTNAQLTYRNAREREIYQMLLHYRTSIYMRGKFNATYQSVWDNVSRGSDDKLMLWYAWRFRQFNSSIEYVRSQSKADIVDNSLWVKLSRSFYGRFRGRAR